MEQLGGYSEARKKEIFKKNSFTKNFLDNKIDPNLRNLNLVKDGDRLSHEISQKEGSEWEQLSVSAFLIIGMRVGILNNVLTSLQNSQIIRDLIILGYEVGNHEDIKLLGPDIFAVLAYWQFFAVQSKPGMQNSFSEINAKKSFVDGVLTYGIALKNVESFNADLKPFKDFIETLDMSGI